MVVWMWIGSKRLMFNIIDVVVIIDCVLVKVMVLGVWVFCMCYRIECVVLNGLELVKLLIYRFWVIFLSVCL